jgi:hypothetical protein
VGKKVRMNRVSASIGLVIAGLVLADTVRATADIEITTSSPHNIRILPGDSAGMSVLVTNLGPEAADVTLTSVIYSFDHGYAISLTQPDCGVLTQSGTGDIDYTLSLSTIAPGEGKLCNFIVNRDTSDSAASDILLDWSVSPSDDPDPTNNQVDFNIGSLIDIAIAIEPQTFDIDDGGIAHEVVRLRVINHGPSNVAPFSVGACTDNGWPGFAIDGNFAGGCGSADYSPICFDFGFGFLVPELSVEQEYACSIQLTSFTPYETPLTFGISTDVLSNPATGGGSLRDIFPENNQAILTLAPFVDPIFKNGFEL